MLSNAYHIRVCGVFLSLILVASCATPLADRVGQLKTGMDKTQVLDLAGNPKRTARQSSGDVWTYVYYKNDQYIERDLRFEAGHLVAISDPRVTAKDGKPEQDVVLKQYEELVNEAKSKKSSMTAP